MFYFFLPSAYGVTGTNCTDIQIILELSTHSPSPERNDANNGSINIISTSGGSEPYTYEWSNGASGNKVYSLDSGHYSVIVTDANGCTGHDTFYVRNVYTAPPYLASFEKGNLWPERGEFETNELFDGKVYVTDNPEKEARNNSDFVAISRILPVDAPPSYCRAEYKINGYYPIPTKDKHHIYQWQIYFPNDYLKIENIWWDWWIINQIKTNPCEATKAHDNVNVMDAIAYNGGIFNDLIRTDNENHVFRFRAKPDSALVNWPIIRNKWLDITYEVFWTTSSAGYYNIFIDDKKITEATNVRTLPLGWKEGLCDIDFDLGLYASWNDVELDSQYFYFDNIQVYVDSNLSNICPECINCEQVNISVSGSITDEKTYNSFDGAIDLQIVGGTAPYSFYWNNGDTTQNIQGLSGGDYEVTVSDKNGCSVTTSFFVKRVHDTTNNITEPFESNITVFPNPTQNRLTITGIDVPLGIYIYDIYGKQLGYFENTSKIDLSRYSNGLYFITIITRNSIHSFSITRI